MFIIAVMMSIINHYICTLATFSLLFIKVFRFSLKCRRVYNV